MHPISIQQYLRKPCAAVGRCSIPHSFLYAIIRPLFYFGFPNQSESRRNTKLIKLNLRIWFIAYYRRGRTYLLKRDLLVRVLRNSEKGAIRGSITQPVLGRLAAPITSPISLHLSLPSFTIHSSSIHSHSLSTLPVHLATYLRTSNILLIPPNPQSTFYKPKSHSKCSLQSSFSLPSLVLQMLGLETTP